MASQDKGGPRNGGHPLWQIITQSSAYIVDMHEGYLIRVPQNGEASMLRKDHQHIPLLLIEHLVVGQPMVCWLDIRKDGVLTRRSTTPVAGIQLVKE